MRLWCNSSTTARETAHSQGDGHETWRGTQQAEWNGIPATGKEVTLSSSTIYRIANGKIQECWWFYDVLSVLQQLGVMRQPEQEATT